MTASLAVICFNTPNNRDILGENAYFAEDNTAAAFVDQLQQALACPNEARERGRAAGELAPRRFSWQAGAKTIVNTYALVHDSNPKSAREHRETDAT
jgi:glycosyltransferase involved in cell wall biosynthesis